MTRPKIVNTIPSVTLFGETYRNVEVEVNAYVNNGQMAVRLLCEPEDGWQETLAKVSINVPGQTPDEGCFFVGVYSEHAEVTTQLVLAGVLTLTGREVTSGPFGATFAEARLTASA